MVNKLKTIIRRILFYLLLFFAVIVTSSGLIVWLYGDQMKRHFVMKANEYLDTPVEVKNIEISLWEKFPFISVAFEEVSVRESYPASEKNLLQADKIIMTFNPIYLIQGDYVINKVYLENADILIRVDRKNRPNYLIFKAPEKDQQGADVSFDIKSIVLDSVKYRYEDDYNEVIFGGSSDYNTLSLNKKDSIFAIHLEGALFSQHLTIRENDLLLDEHLYTDVTLSYNENNQNIDFINSKLTIRNNQFLLTGNYKIDQYSYMNLRVEAEQTSWGTLLSFLPGNYQELLNRYKSEGNVYFDLIIEGRLGPGETPSLSSHFGFRNSALLFPETNSRIESLSFDGRFIMPTLQDLSKAELTLENIQGKIDQRTFKANLFIKDFTNLFVKTDVEGSFDLEKLQMLIPKEYLTQATGLIHANVQFEGRINQLKTLESALKVQSSGTVEMETVSLQITSSKLPVKEVSGTLHFNKNEIDMKGVNGYLGKSHFILDGKLKNIIPYLLSDHQAVEIQADLVSKNINLDELLGDSTSASGNQQYAFDISPLITLNFDCTIESLNFRRFKGRDIYSKIRVKNQILAAPKLLFSGMGGKVSMKGIIDSSNKNYIDIMTDVDVTGLYMDSIFYVFENFNQDFLQDKHLKGKMNAKFSTGMSFSKALDLFDETLTADIHLTIDDGELNNFEPLQAIASYLPDDDLSKLKFLELSNDIHIENKKIYIPAMEVSSNVNTIRIGGTHTFDQHIDYRLVVPLPQMDKEDKDKAFGAVEDDGIGAPKLHLRILGTTDDYEVLYDKEGLKENIITDLKAEVKELKDAFKNKGDKKVKKLELEEDEYFDW